MQPIIASDEIDIWRRADSQHHGNQWQQQHHRYDSLGNLVGSEKLINQSLVLRTYHSYDTDNRLSAQG